MSNASAVHQFNAVATITRQHAQLREKSVAALDAVERAKRDMTPAEQAEQAAREQEMKRLENHHADYARLAKLRLPDDVRPATPAAPLTRFSETPTRATTERAFNKWLRTGLIDGAFTNVISVSGGSDGTAVAYVPNTVMEVEATPRTSNVFRQAVALMGMSPVATDDVNYLELPTIDTFNGGMVPEGAVADGYGNVDFDTVNTIKLIVQPYHSGPAWLSMTKIGQTRFGIIKYLQSDLAYAKELALEKAIASTIAADVALTRGVTTASTAGITEANLTALGRSLPGVFDYLKVIILSRPAFEAAEDFVGEVGSAVTRDTRNPDVLRINGIPALKTMALDGFGASKVIGLVVSMVGFRLRDVQDKVIRYAAWPKAPDRIGYDYVGYHGFGYGVDAVAKLKTPAL